MIIQKEKVVYEVKRFKEGLFAMPFVLNVVRFNNSMWSITLDKESSNLEKEKVEKYVEGFSGEFQYEFFKKVDGEVFKEAMIYRSNVYPKYVKHVANTTLIVITAQELKTEEFDELNQLVESLDENYDLAIRKDFKNNIIKKKKQFGSDFIDEFSAMNHANNKSTIQIMNLIGKYPSIPILCLTGSIETLYVVISSIQPDEDITQQEIDEFKKRIEIFLGEFDD